MKVCFLDAKLQRHDGLAIKQFTDKSTKCLENGYKYLILQNFAS
jgi:hypothetical protein